MDNIIEIKDLHFAYPHGGEVLKGLNLSVSHSDRLALTGANGVGKSTLFHLLVGLKKPQRGRLHLFGQNRTCEKDFIEVRRRIGLVFQDPDDQLFCPSVFEDLAFGLLNLGKSPQETRDKVEQTLQDLHLSHLRDRITHTLSGGEKRLVSLASVLVMQPDFLLLDEPTNALDEETRERLCQILEEIPQGFILISHDSHFRRRVCQTSRQLKEGQLLDETPGCKHAGL